MRYTLTSAIPLLLIMVFDLSCKKEVKDSDPKTVLKEVIENYRKHSSISFDLVFNAKYYSRSDTLTSIYYAELYRDSSEKIAGGYYWIAEGDSSIQVYSPGFLNTFSRNDGTVVSYNIEGIGRNMIHSGKAFSTLQTYFLYFGFLENAFADSSFRFTVDIDKDQTNSLRIVMLHPDEQGLKNVKTVFILDRQKKLIESVSFLAQRGENAQYFNWKYSNIRLGMSDPRSLLSKVDSAMANYRIVDIPQAAPKIVPEKNVGEFAPKFEGLKFPSMEPFTFNPSQKRLTLIDFWYTGCVPCMMAIPNLNKLTNKYPELAVIGVNAFDIEEGRIENFKDFVKKNKIEYDIIKSSITVNDSFGVLSYPTLFLVNQEGMIVFKESGYYIGQGEILDSLILHQLTQY